MDGLGICYFCLVDRDEKVEALTLREGTSVCLTCARDWGDQLKG